MTPYWGVRREDGVIYTVQTVADALHTERRLRETGEEAAAMLSLDGHEWHPLPLSSAFRPDPAPPAGPRRVPVTDVLGRSVPWWARVLARWGRAPSPFGRSRRE